MATRDDYIYYARLAEQGERYEDMIKYMKIVAEVSRDLFLVRKQSLYWLENHREVSKIIELFRN